MNGRCHNEDQKVLNVNTCTLIPLISIVLRLFRRQSEKNKLSNVLSNSNTCNEEYFWNVFFYNLRLRFVFAFYTVVLRVACPATNTIINRRTCHFSKVACHCKEVKTFVRAYIVRKLHAE